ncbi:MAG TPA: ATP-binding protein [Humisphaera sp.]|jgi:signal transduction histidine kinase|nr:ATP-binding protein [Humisphaera sp.]
MRTALLNVDLKAEQDVVLTRQRARQIGAFLGLTPTEQTAFATAVSEIARNAFRYAGGGRVEFWVRDEMSRPLLGARIADRGMGINNLKEILAGQYQSATGMGLGIIGSKRLCYEFDIESTPGAGTTVTMAVRLHQRSDVSVERIAALTAELAQRGTSGPLEEVQAQNRELMTAMEDMQARQSEIERLNSELSETNRGVLALYAELDERAETLRRASEYKSRFLSDMTHELRTPLNGMISLARLLLDRTDGDLTPEQLKQVQLIHKSAISLGEMVNDLLDLAKIEAGKTTLRISEFAISDVLATLRGVFRPLFGGGGVALEIEDPVNVHIMCSDEGKVTQILRNLVSNALKFTESGHVRIRADAGPNQTVIYSVADTGIGIPADQLEAIFEDFTQIESPVQRRVHGTGLGLPLTRKLCRILGGDIQVTSEVGIGSTFSVILPVSCPEHLMDAPESSDVQMVGERAGA